MRLFEHRLFLSRLSRLLSPSLRNSLIACILMLPSSTLWADLPGNTNIYVALGGSYVGADGEIEDIGLNDNTFSSTGRIGYTFGSLIGAELGYFELGGVDEGALSVDMNAVTAAVVLNAPLAFIDVYGKLGLAVIDADADIESPIGDLSFDGDGTELFGAVGGEFDMGPLNFFLEYARFQTDLNIDVDVISAGVKLEF